MAIATSSAASRTATRLGLHRDLEESALEAIRGGQRAGRSRATLADVVGRVLARHVNLGPDAGRVVGESDAATVADVVAELIAALPQRSGPWAETVGPVYRTEQVRALLGTTRPVSRQAVADRSARRTLLALRTSDGHTVYPAWQFRRRQVLPGLSAVLRAFVDEHGEPVVDDWTLGSWLRAPLEALDGDSVADRLSAGDVDAAVTAARTAARRWAR